MEMVESAIRRIRKYSYMLRGYGVNGRELRVYPDDIFLVGYPKSGNTWLDFLVACLRMERAEDVDYHSIESNVADIYFNDAKLLRGLARPRFLKSHEVFDPRYPKVIYIVRDPRAVAVSYYHHLVGLESIDRSSALSQFIPQFIRGDFDGFGNWEAHARGWMKAHDQYPERVMIVKYEDLKSETEITLSDIAAFLGIKATSEKIREAIAWSSPENMRRLEVAARESGLSSFANFKEGSFFVRTASSGGWKQELGEALEMQIRDSWGGTMRELGYIDGGNP